jgi:hypothetical protein
MVGHGVVARQWVARNNGKVVAVLAMRWMAVIMADEIVTMPTISIAMLMIRARLINVDDDDDNNVGSIMGDDDANGD